MKRFLVFIFLIFSLFSAKNLFAADETKTVGATGADYSTLKLAFDAINAGTLTGNITLQIIANTTETASAVLNASSPPSNYSTVTIYPTVSGLSISGNLAFPLIKLDGADNVTLDGRVNVSGSAKDLIITNTSTDNTAGTSTITFVNDASSNTIKFCTIKGSSSGQSIILFMGTSGTLGNDDNTIDNNDITNAGGNRPGSVFYSMGNSGKENSGNTISNNNIYDFMSSLAISASIAVNLSGNNKSWTISGNSFYETTDFVPTSVIYYAAIKIIPSTGNGGFVVTDNYIGGSAPNCGGDPWTKTNGHNNQFYGIWLNVDATNSSSVQGNTIKNFDWANLANQNWYGIYVAAGSVNIGNLTGNTIGGTTGTNSITITNGTQGSNIFGIYVLGAGTKTINNNIIGSINSNPYFIYGIGHDCSVNVTINNNTITSISATSRVITGIQSGISSGGTNIITISDNTISNLTNLSTDTLGQTYGIRTIRGVNIITNNTIRDLISNGISYGYFFYPSLTGIRLGNTNAASGGQTITGNRIYNLSNTNSTTSASTIIGIHYSGPASGTNTIENNFIYSMSLSSSTSSSEIFGIYIGYTGCGTATFTNNIVSLGEGISTGYSIYGIYVLSNTTNTPNLYFNTVDIEGAVTDATTTGNTYALNDKSLQLRDYKNNIFNNSRSGGITGKHYAVSVDTLLNLTLDYNDYYAPNGVLGNFNGDITTLANWKTETSQDAHSLNNDPVFVDAGSQTDTDYKPQTTLEGIAGTGITLDYEGTTRDDPPTMGAFEYSVTVPVLTTSASSSITKNSASGGGNITNTGGGTVTTRGICWALTSGVTTAGSLTTESGSFGTGSYTASYTSLTPNTLYYTAAYGTNSSGTGYGNEIQFVTTPDVPTNLSNSNISYTSYTFNWTAPSPAGNQTYTYNVQIDDNSDFGSPFVNQTGIVSTTTSYGATSLLPGTLYYSRVSATNTSGTGTWASNSVTTTAISAPSLTTTNVTVINSTTANGGGNITNTGGANVTTRGICWALTSGVTTAGSHTTESGSYGTGSYTASYASLTPNTLYYTAAYGTNTAGTGYGNEIQFVTAPGVPTNLSNTDVFNTSYTFNWNAPSPAGNQTYTYNVQIDNNSDFSSPFVDQTGISSTTTSYGATLLTSGTLYYNRVSATNISGTSTWASNSVTTSTISAPSLTTTNVSGISSTTANGGGNITNTGGATVTTRGICWALTSGVTTAGSHTTESGSFGTGSFTASYTSLTSNTLYYTAAYGSNSAGTAYGNEIHFVMAPGVPTNLSYSDVHSKSYKFNWTAPSPAGNQTYTYNVQIDDNSDFSSPFVDQTGISSTTTSYGATSLSPETFYYSRVSATNTTGTSTWASSNTNTLAETVYLSEGYSSGIGNNPDNSYWNIRYFNQLANAISNSEDGSLIIIKAFGLSTSYTTSTINTDDNSFEIDDADFIINNSISGDGLIKVISTGKLMMKDLAASTTKTFPITDGTYNYTMTVNTADNSAPDIKVRIKNNTQSGNISTDFWEIEGPTNLNATVTLRVEKAAISPKTLNSNTQLRYLEGGRYVPVDGNKFSIEEFNDYYIITITHVNAF